MTTLELIDRFYASMGGDDWTDFIALCDPEIEWIQNDGFPYGGRHVGPQAVIKGVFETLRGHWDGFGFTREETHDAGDVATALGYYAGVHRETGKAFKAAAAHVLYVRDGKVVRFKQYTDTALVVAAAT